MLANAHSVKDNNRRVDPTLVPVKKKPLCTFSGNDNLMDRFDFFSLPMYNFHFNDSMTVSSCCGVCVSILIIVTVVIVAFGKVV